MLLEEHELISCKFQYYLVLFWLIDLPLYQTHLSNQKQPVKHTHTQLAVILFQMLLFCSGCIFSVLVQTYLLLD